MHNLAVPVYDSTMIDPVDELGWLSGLNDRFPRLRTLGVLVEDHELWVALCDSKNSHAALRALPTALTRLDLNVPQLCQWSIQVRV